MNINLMKLKCAAERVEQAYKRYKEIRHEVANEEMSAEDKKELVDFDSDFIDTIRKYQKGRFYLRHTYSYTDMFDGKKHFETIKTKIEKK